MQRDEVIGDPDDVIGAQPGEQPVPLSQPSPALVVVDPVAHTRSLAGASDSRVIVVSMCRNIRQLHNFEPPATSREVHEAALQYVRKVAGTTKPSKANEDAFNEAVHEIAHATQHLLDHLSTTAPPKNREEEALKARARAAKRYASA